MFSGQWVVVRSMVSSLDEELRGHWVAVNTLEKKKSGFGSVGFSNVFLTPELATSSSTVSTAHFALTWLKAHSPVITQRLGKHLGKTCAPRTPHPSHREISLWPQRDLSVATERSPCGCREISLWPQRNLSVAPVYKIKENLFFVKFVQDCKYSPPSRWGGRPPPCAPPRINSELKRAEICENPPQNVIFF